jgi:hypothetical protein
MKHLEQYLIYENEYKWIDKYYKVFYNILKETKYQNIICRIIKNKEEVYRFTGPIGLASSLNLIYTYKQKCKYMLTNKNISFIIYKNFIHYENHVDIEI